ncbi:hypothetical protein BVC93_27590 [Mycobacterium sp. MS1601]|nr:hypothetical protein BVC93_27590 [Mycobacterium sp. MS1601]
MPILLMFGKAREVAGTSRANFSDQTLEELMTSATERFGEPFTRVLNISRVWVDGSPPEPGVITPLGPSSEVTVLPPVAGG